MIPFFSASALPGYEPWWPNCVLAAGWALFALRLVLPQAWLLLADFPLFLLTPLMLVRWFPRRPMPPLLLVLHGGLAWLPIAFALYTAQDLSFARDAVTIPGKPPAHALFIVFFGPLLVALVTALTQGHQGPPL